MKAKITFIVLLVFFIINTSFTRITLPVSEKVLVSFRQEFNAATEVTWTKNNGYFTATFKLNDQYLFAYFSEDGEMIGLSRNIAFTQLPISLQVNLKKRYSAYWISELFEMAINGETMYFATVENADKKVIVKCTSASQWSVFRKMRKM